MTESRAIQRTTRQSPYKMRLVIDLIRGQKAGDALSILSSTNKRVAPAVEKVAAAAREQLARKA